MKEIEIENIEKITENKEIKNIKKSTITIFPIILILAIFFIFIIVFFDMWDNISKTQSEHFLELTKYKIYDLCITEENDKICKDFVLNIKDINIINKEKVIESDTENFSYLDKRNEYIDSCINSTHNKKYICYSKYLTDEKYPTNLNYNNALKNLSEISKEKNILQQENALKQNNQ